MSLLDSSLWEVIKASFNPEIWKELIVPVGETLYMTVISSIIVLILYILSLLVFMANANLLKDIHFPKMISSLSSS